MPVSKHVSTKEKKSSSSSNKKEKEEEHKPPKKAAKAMKKQKKEPAPQRKQKTGQAVVSTFDAWVEKEAKSGKVHAAVKQKEEGPMPKNSMSEWLSRQSVAEHAEKREVVPAVGSTEEWLRKQVSSKLQSEEAEQEEQASQEEQVAPSEAPQQEEEEQATL